MKKAWRIQQLFLTRFCRFLFRWSQNLQKFSLITVGQSIFQKILSRKPFAICLINSKANPAQLSRIWARLEILFSRQNHYLMAPMISSFLVWVGKHWDQMPAYFTHLFFKLQQMWGGKTSWQPSEIANLQQFFLYKCNIYTMPTQGSLPALIWQMLYLNRSCYLSNSKIR